MSREPFIQNRCPKCGSLDVERVRRNWLERIFFDKKYFCRYCAKTSYRVEERVVQPRSRRSQDGP